MADVITYQVDPSKALQNSLKKALEQVQDLTVPFTLIARDWFRSNQAIFSLKGPGKYEDLTENYKVQKQKAVGFIYPILKRSGLLADSITKPGDSNSINIILNGKTLILGTSVPYASAHQYGTKFLPIRPIIFTDGEQSASDERFNRSAAWIMILQDYVLQKSEGIGKVNK